MPGEEPSHCFLSHQARTQQPFRSIRPLERATLPQHLLRRRDADADAKGGGREQASGWFGAPAAEAPWLYRMVVSEEAELTADGEDEMLTQQLTVLPEWGTMYFVYAHHYSAADDPCSFEAADQVTLRPLRADGRPLSEAVLARQAIARAPCAEKRTHFWECFVFHNGECHRSTATSTATYWHSNLLAWRAPHTWEWSPTALSPSPALERVSEHGALRPTVPLINALITHSSCAAVPALAVGGSLAASSHRSATSHRSAAASSRSNYDEFSPRTGARTAQREWTLAAEERIQEEDDGSINGDAS